jgi:ABC-type polysaccharide transport system permease subunit
MTYPYVLLAFQKFSYTGAGAGVWGMLHNRWVGLGNFRFFFE